MANSRRKAELIEELNEHVSAPSLQLYLEEDAKGEKVQMVRVEVAEVDIINDNGRFYPRSAYEAANAKAQSDIASGRLWGLLEHKQASDPDKGRLEKIALLYRSIGIEGNKVVAKAQIVNSTAGQNLKALLEAGVQVGISTAGGGGVRWMEARELDKNYPRPHQKIAVVGDNFHYRSIDATSTPSNRGGTITHSLSETLDDELITHVETKTVKTELQRALQQLQLTESEFKSKYPEWYGELQTVEAQPQIQEAVVPTSIQNHVLALTAALQDERLERKNSTRRNIAIGLLEAAALPKAGVIEGFDMDESFRQEIEGLALSAETDELAKAAVEKKIKERRFYMSRAALSESKQASSGVKLPVGNTETASAPEKPEVKSNLVRNIRASLSL